MDSAYSKIVSLILSAQINRPDQRILVAIAGAPGSGKSTITARLIELLNNQDESHQHPSIKSISKPGLACNEAVAIPVDGFHYPRKYLDELSNREEAYARRGAPWTFDVDGILSLVGGLKRTARLPGSERPAIMAPSFNHALKDPVEDDIQIPSEAGIVILEGNYLLLNVGKWREISEMVDVRVFVDVDVDCARGRVARRHVQAGIEESLERGMARFEGNDALNGELIRANLTEFDVRIESFDIT